MNKEIEVMQQTLEHKNRVADLLLQVNTELQHRAIHHDDSKFSNEEFPYFVEETLNLKNLTYGSDEYNQALARLKPALDHHYANNNHHPEFHLEGIYGMTLIDLIEMLADWKAATERHKDGNLTKSIDNNGHRFGYDDVIRDLLYNTAMELGWINTNS